MRDDERQQNTVMLTIDLTTAVADEAIEQGVSIIIAYRVYLLHSKPLELSLFC